MNLNQEEQGNKMGQLIAKCWADESFKQQLLADPAATLKAEGVESPSGLSIKAVADDDKVVHLVIPAKPQRELSEDELAQISAGNPLGAALVFAAGWLGGKIADGVGGKLGIDKDISGIVLGKKPGK